MTNKKCFLADPFFERILGSQKSLKILEKWVTRASNRPAPLRAGATGKGREGDKSPSQGLGRKGFMNLSTEHLHALRHKASADYGNIENVRGILEIFKNYKNMEKTQSLRNLGKLNVRC